MIMIGEIRDYETAQIAIQASLTGHLVLATVHTNDAPSTVTRMIDMGVEPVPAQLVAARVLAQRLVRRLCPHCRRADANGRYHPVGCDQCGQYRATRAARRLRADGRRRQAARPDPRPRRRVADLRRRRGAGLRSMREDGDRLIGKASLRRGSDAGHARVMLARPCSSRSTPAARRRPPRAEDRPCQPIVTRR